MAKKKFKMISNFIYGVKTVNRIDKTYIIQKIINLFFSSLLTFLYSYALKVAVSGIEEKLEYKQMIINVSIVMIVLIISNIIVRILNNSFWYKSERIIMLLQREKSIRTIEMDYELLERPETQDTLEKASRYLGSYSGIVGLVNYGFTSLGNIVTFIVACAIVISVNPWLILIVCAIAIFKIIVENRKQKKEKTEFSDKVPPIWRRISYINNISTNLGIGKDLRIYEMNNFIEKERKEVTNEYFDLFKKRSKRNLLFDSLIQIISIFDTLFLYAFMIYEVIENNMTLATFSFMIANVKTLINSLYRIISNNSYIVRCNLEAIDYRSFMDLEYVRECETEEIESSMVEIEFKNVYYSYYMQEGYALEDVSFKINKGEKLALVGYNGAGKTTLMKLISGLYHPTKGNIYINGIDMETIKRESLQKLISPVYQETVHFALEIYENVAMACEEKIDLNKVDDIIKLVELDKKIDSLPLKAKTIITRELEENGIELSGGESQKLSLARAIYKNAPLFILDEPTSALDALSEYNMYNNFNKMIGRNSAIYISHRLSSTKFCDRILLLDKGHIIEEGSHYELMNKDSKYKELFTMQANYYKGGSEDED